MYELRPDIFPYGYLTPVESDLWDIFYQHLKESRGK